MKFRNFISLKANIMAIVIQVLDKADGRTIEVPLTDNSDGTFSFPTAFNPKPTLLKSGPVSSLPATASLIGYDAASLAAGAAIVGPDMPLLGATFNDSFKVSANISLAGMRVEGICKALGIVGIRFVNNTLAAIDLPVANYTVTKTNQV